MTAQTALATLFTPEPVTISASRLKALGGEKGTTGCERKTAGAYLFGMRQSGSDATEFGTALHTTGEVHQTTGEIPDPESRVATVYRAGAHLVTAIQPMLVEWEHWGILPDGVTPFVAFLDGHTPDGIPMPPFGDTVVINDLKTTSNPMYSLKGAYFDEDDEDAGMLRPAGRDPTEDPYALRQDLQAMFYAWILLCSVHWYCPPLPEGQYGPKHWRVWDPKERRAERACLRWIYFLTRGTPRAWEAVDWTTPGEATEFMNGTIMPLVVRINALHQWRAANPDATLDQIDRNLTACGGRGRWCGVGERDACDFSALGTPVLDLIQLKVRPTMSAAERLAALKNKAAAGASAAAPATPPATETPAASPPATAATTPTETTAAATASTSAATPAPAQAPAASAAQTAAASAPEAPKARRGRPPRAAAPPAAPPGAGINPPECVDALAELTAQAQGAPTVAPAAVVTAAVSEDRLIPLVRQLLSTGCSVGVVVNVAVQR